MKYYDKDGYMNEQAFKERLEEIHAKIDDTPDLKGLIILRGKLYRLKNKHEKSGKRFLECEYEILALNELIAETREANNVKQR